MKDFKTFNVWKSSHELTLEIYKITKCFPKEELYGLTNQIRRCSSSIPANIAEGCGRQGDADFARFLQIATGSACELEYHLLLACDLKYLERCHYEELSEKLTLVKKMLIAFIKKLKP